MTTQNMSARTFPAMPPITMESAAPENPLKGVLITVFTLKIIVSAFLLATVSLAPPAPGDGQYTAVAAAN